MPNFGNPGSALSALGGQMKATGRNLQNRGNGGGVGGGMSARQHRKMVGNLVDAHRAMNETETLHHGQRLDQSADAAIRLREAGFANVNAETAHVKIQGTGKVKPAAGSKEDAEARAHNPSADVHGHPFAGHPFGNGTHPVIALRPDQYSVTTPTAPKPVAARTVQPLALEGGKSKFEAASPSARPTATKEPRVFVAGESVVKKGSSLDKPAKAQPEIPGKLRSKESGAIEVGIKGKLRGPSLKANPDNSLPYDQPKLTADQWDAKLTAQESAELNRRKAKKKDN